MKSNITGSTFYFIIRIFLVLWNGLLGISIILCRTVGSCFRGTGSNSSIKWMFRWALIVLSGCIQDIVKILMISSTHFVLCLEHRAELSGRPHFSCFILSHYLWIVSEKLVGLVDTQFGKLIHNDLIGDRPGFDPSYPAKYHGVAGETKDCWGIWEHKQL